MWRAIASRGRSLNKVEEPLKSRKERQRQWQKWRKGHRVMKNVQKLRVRRVWAHPARLCSNEGWVNNDLEQDAPVREDTNEEGCQADEGDETLQLGCLGSDSCLTSSLPGLRDEINEA